MNTCSALITALVFAISQPVWSNTFKTEKWTTDNGVRVIFYPAMEVPMLDISLAFNAGSAYDGTAYGLSSLTKNMLNQGNAGLDATAVAEQLADTGAQFSADDNRDMVVFNLRTLTSKKALDQSKTIFTQIINHPDFTAEAFAREQKQLLMAIEQSYESPDEVANINFSKKLYQNHPYAHPLNGTKETVSNLKREQVLDFYKRYYVAKNAVLVMVGAIDSKTAHDIAHQVTQELPSGQQAPPIPQATPLAQAQNQFIDFPSSQTMIRLGQLGIDHQNPNYFALMVGNYILGGGSLVSRLAVEVREKQGLTYGVDSQFLPAPAKGTFIISLSTNKKEADRALSIASDTLNTFIKEGPKQEELDAAKQYLTGSFPLSLSSNRSIATILLRMAIYHLPDDYLDTYISRINAVTIEQIKEAFKHQVNPNAMLLIRVGSS